jgi:hypothetical protein
MLAAEAMSEPVAQPREAPLATPETPPVSTSILVVNSRASTTQSIGDSVVHPIPTLDGFGLFVTAIIMAAAAFWIWRRQ